MYVCLSTEITCNQLTSVLSQGSRSGKMEGECSLMKISLESNRMKRGEASDRNINSRRARSYHSTYDVQAISRHNKNKKDEIKEKGKEK